MQDRRSILTVITAAPSYDLVLLDDVHTELGIATGDTSNDVWFGKAITRISATVSKYCKRVFQLETVNETIYPQLDAYPSQVPGRVQPLQLARWPVADVTSVNVFDVQGNAIPYTLGTDYVLKADEGQLIKLNPFNGHQSSWDPVPTAVVYQAGYATIPEDLQGAVLDLISSAFANRGQDAMLMSITEQGVERRFWVETGKDGRFPPKIREVLDDYRVPTAF